MEFLNKEEFIKFVKEQINIKIEKANEDLNDKEHILYVKLSKNNKYDILNLLNKYNIRHEEHLNDKYWIWINKPYQN